MAESGNASGAVDRVEEEAVAPALDSSNSDDGVGSSTLNAAFALFALLSGVLLWDWSR